MYMVSRFPRRERPRRALEGGLREGVVAGAVSFENRDSGRALIEASLFDGRISGRSSGTFSGRLGVSVTVVEGGVEARVPVGVIGGDGGIFSASGVGLSEILESPAV